MNRFVLLFLLGVSSVSYGSSNKIEGDMNCQVKSSYGVSIKDGISRNYSSHQDQYDVGEPLQIRYSFEPDSFGGHLLEVTLDGHKRSNDILSVGLTLLTIQDSLFNSNTGVSLKHEYRSILFGTNYIGLKRMEGDFWIRNYNKNDWYGMSWTEDGRGLQVLTFDCRNGEENVDTILKLIQYLK